MKMEKYLKTLLFAVLLCLLTTGCEKPRQKYDTQFFDVFDTVSAVSVYAESQEQADEYLDAVHERLLYLHRLFDPYNSYDGISNLKTVNDAAGKSPVSVEPDLFYLLSEGRHIYEMTDGKINIAMGSTLELWHRYRDNALENGNSALPSSAELEATRQYNDIAALETDESADTAYITAKGVSINLGAIAKGYAASEALKVLRDMGCNSALVNLGGNVACFRGDAKETPWKVGVQDPQNPEGLLEVVEIDNGHLVSSGDYQRYYIYDGKKIHHIIDPETLMPADRHTGTTVIMDGLDDGLDADMLSTAFFIMSDDECRKFADNFDDINQVYLISPDGQCEKFY